MNRFNCPNCGSERTRSLPIIHASGTSTVRLTSIYVDTDEDIGVIPSYGKSQTAAARMAAPPAKKEAVTGGFVVCTTVGFLLLRGAIHFLHQPKRRRRRSSTADVGYWHCVLHLASELDYSVDSENANCKRIQREHIAEADT